MIEHPFGIGLSTPNRERLMLQYGIDTAVNSHNLHRHGPAGRATPGLLTFLTMIGIVLWRVRRALSSPASPAQQEAMLYLFLLLLGYLSNGYFQPIFSVYPRLNNLFCCSRPQPGRERRVFAARREARRAASWQSQPRTPSPRPNVPDMRNGLMGVAPRSGREDERGAAT